jgi:predicted GNAT family acetyltransferase
MARVGPDAGETELVALMTPPRNLLLASPDRTVPEGAIRLLAEHLCAQRIMTPGVVAEKELALAFACAFAAKSGGAYFIATDERLYRLDRVEDVAIVGELRPASERDMHFLPFWMKAFTDECFHENAPLEAESARWCVERSTMYILEDGGLPVSMAGSSRQLPRGRAVGPVYTPPYLRGKGYATACVALLSQIILEKGNDYCALFTDLENPVSNSIYQRIGYRPICDFREIKFT